jgi:hypothetical protein
LLVTFPSPHPGAPACPSTPEVLRAKKRAPTPYPSIIFTFRIAIESTKEFAGASIPLAHHARYKLNPNYATTIKQNIDKLLVTKFIEFIKEVTWLSSIVVIPKKNDKLKIYIDFIKINATTKKGPYPLPFIDEMLNMVARYEAYYFLDRYSGYQ